MFVEMLLLVRKKCVTNIQSILDLFFAGYWSQENGDFPAVPSSTESPSPALC